MPPSYFTSTAIAAGPKQLFLLLVYLLFKVLLTMPDSQMSVWTSSTLEEGKNWNGALLLFSQGGSADKGRLARFPIEMAVVGGKKIRPKQYLQSRKGICVTQEHKERQKVFPGPSDDKVQEPIRLLI